MKNKRLLILAAVAIVIIITIIAIVTPKFFQKNKKTTTQTNTLPIYVGCPVTQALCQSSQAIKVPNANYSWLGWSFTKDSQVFAAFDGTLQQQILPLTASGSAAVYVATITSSNGKYQAHYMLPFFKLSEKIKETVLPKKKVKAKDVIFPNNETSTLFQDQNINLSFYVSTTTTALNSTPIDIDPKNFGKIVLP